MSLGSASQRLLREPHPEVRHTPSAAISALWLVFVATPTSPMRTAPHRIYVDASSAWEGWSASMHLQRRLIGWKQIGPNRRRVRFIDCEIGGAVREPWHPHPRFGQREGSVPRYYFNIINDSKIVDVEGREFPDEAAAVAEAQRFIDEWDLAGTHMRVTDANARIARVRRRCIFAFGGIIPSALPSCVRSAKRCHV